MKAEEVKLHLQKMSEQGIFGLLSLISPDSTKHQSTQKSLSTNVRKRQIFLNKGKHI